MSDSRDDGTPGANSISWSLQATSDTQLPLAPWRDLCGVYRLRATAPVLRPFDLPLLLYDRPPACIPAVGVSRPKSPGLMPQTPATRVLLVAIYDGAVGAPRHRHVSPLPPSLMSVGLCTSSSIPSIL